MIKIEDKLFQNRYLTDDKNHIEITDRDKCLECEKEGRPCTYVCPAKVYEWDAKLNLINTAYENCVECGTCRYVFLYFLFYWRNPRGGFGIQHKFG